MSGKGIQFAFQGSEAELIFECPEHEPGLAMNIVFGVGDEFLGLLTQPGSVESEAAADAEDFLGKIEVPGSAGERENAAKLAALNARHGGENHSGEIAPDHDGGVDGDLEKLLAKVGLGWVSVLQEGQDVSLKEEWSLRIVIDDGAVGVEQDHEQSAGAEASGEIVQHRGGNAQGFSAGRDWTMLGLQRHIFTNWRTFRRLLPAILH